MNCSKCNTIIPQGQNICPNCGTSLTVTPLSPAQPQPQPQPQPTPLSNTIPVNPQPQASPSGGKDALAIILLFFFWPAGLIVMWKYTNWSKKIKWLVTAVLIILAIITAAVIFFGVLSALNAEKDNEEQTAKVSAKASPAPAGLLTSLPTAPNGFSWKMCSKMNSYFLLPDGWNFGENIEGDQNACFITKESIKQDEYFSTGLSVNGIQNITTQVNKKPSEFALSTLETVGTTSETGEVLEATEIVETVNGPFRVFHRFVNVIPAITTSESKMYFSVVANDTTDSAFMVIFEAPKESWDIDWQKGQTIISNLGLNPDF